MTETSQPMESTDLSPQGLPSADAEPHVHVPPAAMEAAESSGSGAPQEMPIADAGQKTPPTEYVCPQAEDTPARPRTSHSNRFRNGNLGERREIVVQDIHHVDIIDVDFFFSNLLPIPPETVLNCLDDVIKDLKTKDHLRETNKQTTWTAFSTKKKEDAFFSPFTDIFEAVVSSAQKHSGDPNLKATHSYRMEPNKVPTSDRGEQMRPDACFVRGSPGADADKKTSWFEIACVGEFKTGEKREDVKDVSCHITPLNLFRSTLFHLRISTRSSTGCTISWLMTHAGASSRVLLSRRTLWHYGLPHDLLCTSVYSTLKRCVISLHCFLDLSSSLSSGTQEASTPVHGIRIRRCELPGNWLGPNSKALYRYKGKEAVCLLCR